MRRPTEVIVLRGLAVVAVLGLPQLATANDIEQCLQASEQAQTAREAGRFSVAREALASCLAPACPPLVRQDCATALDDLQRRQPTVVLASSEASAAGTSFRIDDAPIPPVDVGRAVPLDPGTHRFEMTRGARTVRREVVVAEGVKNQSVVLRFDPLAAPVPSRRPAVGTWAVGLGLVGLGVAGVATFAGVGLAAESDFQDQKTRCAPNCSSATSDSLQGRFQLADVALGVGLGATAAGVLVLVLGPRRAAAPAVALSRLRVEF